MKSARFFLALACVLTGLFACPNRTRSRNGDSTNQEPRPCQHFMQTRQKTNAPCDDRFSPIAWTDCQEDSFFPDTPIERWKHASTSRLIVAQGAPDHRGLDTIVNPGQEQRLIGKFVYGIAHKDLEDEKVEIWIEIACRDWWLFGSTYTTKDGQLGTVDGIADDGGRIFFTIPEARRLPVGSYRVKMLVKGDHSEADAWLHVWEKGTQVVVSDIDGTITTSENDGLWTVFDPSSPIPREGANTTFCAYASKGYRLIFLTARPEFTTNGTRRWFSENGFPAGVFQLSPSNKGELGSGAQAYKTNHLRSLVEQRGIAIEWAYGNKGSDLDTYLGVGVPHERIRLIAGEYSGELKGAKMIESYVSESERVACLPPVAP